MLSRLVGVQRTNTHRSIVQVYMMCVCIVNFFKQKIFENQFSKFQDYFNISV